MAKHVLILGCGRSGTSIFGELFDHLPAYTYHSEPAFDLLEHLDYSTPKAVKVPRESEAFPPDPGLSFPLQTLYRFMPEPRQLFWQVRHPLDTIASLKVGISRNWGHHPRPPDWERWLADPLVARCAHHWQYINSSGFTSVAGEVIISRFEDMLREPLAFAVKTVRSLGMDPKLETLPIEEWARRVQDTNNSDFVEAKTSRSYSTRDHSVRIGRWRENLTAEDLDIVLPMVAETAARFGYHDLR